MLQGLRRVESTSAQRPSQDTFWKYCRCVHRQPHHTHLQHFHLLSRQQPLLHTQAPLTQKHNTRLHLWYVHAFLLLLNSSHLHSPPCSITMLRMSFPSPPLPSPSLPQGHHLAVYSLKWSPFHPNVFASCGADWSVKVWDHELQ